jgi:hypothetical protein
MLHVGDGRAVKNEDMPDRGLTATSGAYRDQVSGC